MKLHNCPIFPNTLLILGLKRRLGITAWREFSEDMTQGLKNLQESATYKRTAENIQFAKEIAKEKTSGMVSAVTASGEIEPRLIPLTLTRLEV